MLKVFAVSIGEKYKYCEQYLKRKIPDIHFLKESKENFLLQWNKLHFFNLDLEEPVCVIDLDVLFVNSYMDLLNFPIERGEFLSIRSWWEDEGSCELNGGFYKFFPKDTVYIYEEFKKNKKHWENYFIEKGLKPGPINGEENFVDHMVRQKLKLKFVPDNWVTRMVENLDKEWLAKINLKYPGNYMYIGGKFNSDIKLVHYTKESNMPPLNFLES